LREGPGAVRIVLRPTLLNFRPKRCSHFDVYIASLPGCQPNMAYQLSLKHTRMWPISAATAQASPPSCCHRPLAFQELKRHPLLQEGGAAMAMVALREASRFVGLASRGSFAPARPVLLAHSRGITYKLFVGGESVVSSPPHTRPPYVWACPIICSLSPISRLEILGLHLHAQPAVRARPMRHGVCVTIVRRNARVGSAL
jgi:hypothetical protein